MLGGEKSKARVRMFPIASLLLNFFLGEGELIKKNQTEQSSGVASIACDQARETRGWKKVSAGK